MGRTQRANTYRKNADNNRHKKQHEGITGTRRTVSTAPRETPGTPAQEIRQTVLQNPERRWHVEIPRKNLVSQCTAMGQAFIRYGQKGINGTMKTLLTILAAMLLQGCTMYTIDKVYDPVTKMTTTHVSIKSTRDLEQPFVNYERGKKGTDDYTKFSFSAESVDNNTDAFVGMFQGMMGMMMGMMEKMMQLQLPPTLPPDS